MAPLCFQEEENTCIKSTRISSERIPKWWKTSQEENLDFVENSNFIRETTEAGVRESTEATLHVLVLTHRKMPMAEYYYRKIAGLKLASLLK